LNTPVVHQSKVFVRGQVLASGYRIREKPNATASGCIVEYISQVDLKGIPSSLINIVAERQPLLVAGLRKALTGSKTSKSGNQK